MRVREWALPVAWMGVIFVLSSDVGSAQTTGQLLLPALRWLLPPATPLQLDALHMRIRTAAHLTEYGILAALWFRAFVRSGAYSLPAAGWAALGISLVWASLDETHQSLVPSRTGSPVDVAVDTIGALAAVAIGRMGWPLLHRVTSGLLWMAVLGGGFVLVVDASLGVSSGYLWVAVAAGALALIARRRWAGRLALPPRWSPPT